MIGAVILNSIGLYALYIPGTTLSVMGIIGFTVLTIKQRKQEKALEVDIKKLEGLIWTNSFFIHLTVIYFYV